MKIKYVDVKCANCGYEDNVASVQANETEFCLKSYKEYKDRPVYRCENCDYCSYDLTHVDKSENKVIKSEEYKKTLGYEELEGLTDLWEQYIQSYNAYDYQCASMIYEDKKDYDNAFVSLFRCVELKEALQRRYHRTYLEDLEDLDEDEIKDFEKLDELLHSSAENDLEHLLFMFENVSKNDFNKTIYIEVLIRFGEMKQAKKIQAGMNIPQDIKDYLKSLED